MLFEGNSFSTNLQNNLFGEMSQFALHNCGVSCEHMVYLKSEIES